MQHHLHAGCTWTGGSTCALFSTSLFDCVVCLVFRLSLRPSLQWSVPSLVSYHYLICESAAVANFQMVAAYQALGQHVPPKDGVVVESAIESGDQREASSKWQSWKVTVAAGATTAVVVLAINASLLAYATLQCEVADGMATLYEGKSSPPLAVLRVIKSLTWLTGGCATPSTISTSGHSAINILSTMLLSASNAGAQLLVAPTRSDVTRAHAQNRWLDVGIPSLRNLCTISLWRTLGWLVLMASSIPLRLLYNSVLFQSASGHSYQAALVTKDFFDEQTSFNRTQIDWNIAGAGAFEENVDVFLKTRDMALRGELMKLNQQECVAAYGAEADTESDKGNLLVVAKEVLHASNGGLMKAGKPESFLASTIHRAEDKFNDLEWACGRHGESEGCKRPGLVPAYSDERGEWIIQGLSRCDLVV